MMTNCSFNALLAGGVKAGLTALVALMMQACVNSPTGALDLRVPFTPPKDQVVGSQPGASKTGVTPDINAAPQAQTEQMTEAERAEIQSDFKTTQSNPNVEAARQSQQDYRRDLREMQRLLDEQQRKRRSQNF